jgi:alpha-1,6-mannosyltransferase
MAAARRTAAGVPGLLLIGAVLCAGTLAGPVVHAQAGDVAFAALAIAQGLLVLCATRLAEEAARWRGTLILILGVGVALRLALVFLEPHLSDDAYRYVWDGRVQAAGINPYRYVPAAPDLAFLRDAAIFPSINRADYAVTIYPPAAQLLFLLVNLVADGMLAMKLAMVACEAVAVAVLIDLLRRLGRPAARVIAYAWHPLAVWEIAGSAHVDAAMIAVMMLGLWIALVPGRRLLATIILTVAALVKPPAVLALSLVWRPWDWRAPALATGVAAAFYVPYLSVGAGVIGFLPGYLGEERIADGDGFWLLASLEALFGPLTWGKSVYLAAAAVLLGALALGVALRREQGMEARLRSLFWLFLAFVLLLSPDYAWYYLALLPFVALFGPAPGWAATIACFLLYDVVGDDLEIAFALRDTAVNLVVLAALLLSLRPRQAATPALEAGGPMR